METTVIKCPQCGSHYSQEKETNTYKCLSCGSTYQSNTYTAPSNIVEQPIYVQQVVEQKTVSDCDWLTTLLLAFFVGVFGVHRFYVGKIGSGIFFLLTGGGCGFLFIVDFFVILAQQFRDSENRRIVQKKHN